MKLFIKNLNSKKNIPWLQSVLDELKVLYHKEINLGELVLSTAIPQEQFKELKERLEEEGLEIIYDRKQILAEQIKYIICEMLSKEERPDENYSRYISNHLHLNYTYLANIFSETQGITIEHFTINLKIEKVKQLLLYSDYSISQVADLLHYSSIGHLSNQFKKITGINPSEFKKQVQSGDMIA